MGTEFPTDRLACAPVSAKTEGDVNTFTEVESSKAEATASNEADLNDSAFPRFAEVEILIESLLESIFATAEAPYPFRSEFET